MSIMSLISRGILSIVLMVGVVACVSPPPPLPPTPTAEEHFRQGMSLLRDGYYDGAITSFQTAVSMNPNYTEAHYYLGQAYEKKNMDAKAEVAYRDCIRTNARYVQAHEALGLLLYRLSRFPEAKAELEMAVSLGSVSPEVYTKLGEIYLVERQCVKARQMFEKALSLNSSFYPAQDGLKRAKTTCGGGDGGGYRPPSDGGTKKLKTFQGGGKALDPKDF